MDKIKKNIQIKKFKEEKMDKYILERDGQIDFYKTFLPRINPTLSLEEIILDNNDGVLNGNLLEFKLTVSDLNAVLFQCIKYLSMLRIKGKPVPSNIVIIDLNATIAWVYDASLYLTDIEKVYVGGASKGNSGFIGGKPKYTLHYDIPLNTEKLINILKEKIYTKVHIDENCVVGWAKTFYSLKPTARKEDFIGDDSGKHKTVGEIRKPTILDKYIIAYKGVTNIKFNYLMDRLNDTLLKKNLGAFYTPPQYAKKSAELVRKAIARVPEGNDYVIIDRCAGTGNLEVFLTDEELGHCIVSTIEYYEYKVLLELIGAKVRCVIPPVETTETFNSGLVTGADALSREYIENPIIKKYIENKNCTIILYENPPYAETTSIEWHKVGKSRTSSTWKQSYVVENMKKEVSGATSNDLGNAFIWSAFRYYLRQPTDSYVVYSPVKYWKVQGLVKKSFMGGFAFNRRFFHTNTDACIMCALWGNIDDFICEQIDIRAFDIKENELVEMGKILPVKKIHTLYSQKYYDRSSDYTDKSNGILVGLDGLEAPANNKRRIGPKYSETILGYMVVDSSGFDNPDTHSSLLVAGRYNGNGFFVRKNNYLEKLPMFVASRYITYNRSWTERGRIMKSADGANTYFQDVQSGKLTQFLLKCLLFTCLEMQNHMRTFIGSDGRTYRNELCLDDTNGENIAICDLKSLVIGKDEKTLLQQWENVLFYAKKCANYNPKLTYGVYQIAIELDVSQLDEKTNKVIWTYIELHTALQALRRLVQEYYNNTIVPILFEYEFLK